MSGPPPAPSRRPARRHGAVGAVVVDDLRRVLVLEREVFRQGHWVHEVNLPKGELQPSETDSDAALAEVLRLTGFHDLEVLADLGRSPVEYEHRGVTYRRTEHFFLVRLRSQLRREAALERDERARLYTAAFADGFEQAARRLTFPSEQSAVLRARAWFPG